MKGLILVAMRAGMERWISTVVSIHTLQLCAALEIKGALKALPLGCSKMHTDRFSAKKDAVNLETITSNTYNKRHFVNILFRIICLKENLNVF